MRILVTGAGGFIGGVACATLRERGHDVLALVRRPGSAPDGTTPVLADLTDAAGLRTAIQHAGPEAVLHCAAETGAQRDPAKLAAANVDGLNHLISACATLEPAPKIVFTSTVVTGDPRGALLTEERPLPVQTDYGRSKQEGERLLLGSRLPVVIVRPCHVYGPGGWFATEMVPRLRQPGRFAIIGKGENDWDVVHVDDVASACALALERGAPGEVYHCADDVPTTYAQFMERTAEALGVGRPRHLPVWLARRVAGDGPVDALVRSARTSNAKLKADLGWVPEYPDSRAGIPAAVAVLDEGAPML